MKCGKCGTALETGAEFCGNCGTAVAGGPVGAVPATPTTPVSPAPVAAPAVVTPPPVPAAPLAPAPVAQVAPGPVPALGAVAPVAITPGTVKDSVASWALGLGIGGIVVGFFIPIGGLAVGGFGLYKGITALKSNKRQLATIGIVVSALALAFSVVMWISYAASYSK